MFETESENPSLILKLLVVIADGDRTEHLTSYLKEAHVRMQYACTAHGTANSEVLDMLGLDGTEKVMILCLVPDFHTRWLLKYLPEKFQLEKRGHGIAFSIPMLGISRPVLSMFTGEALAKLKDLMAEKLSTLMELKERMEKEAMDHEIDKPNETRHDLVVAIVNQGYSEDLMEKAKEAGATGGTLINARRTGLEDGSTFLGMPVQSPKEIVMILTDRTIKMAVMKAINHDFGINSEAHGIVFSLPVDSVAGLRPAHAQ